MVRKYLLGATYALGEKRHQYSEIVGFEKVCEERKLPMYPELLGLGSFFSTLDIYQCASASIDRTLQLSAIPPEAIDQVIFCSSFFPEPFLERNRRIGTLLKRWEISPQVLWGVSGSGCTDVLCSIDLAGAMLELGRARNILVVGIESALTDTKARILSYGVVSDASVSVIISDGSAPARAGRMFEILSSAMLSHVGEIGHAMAITDSPSGRAFVQRLLKASGQQLTDIAKVFSNNTFLPVKKNREALLGFSREQMYLENVRKTGHCLSCDPIINLADSGTGSVGTHYVLYSEAEGHTGGLVLRQCTSIGAEYASSSHSQK